MKKTLSTTEAAQHLMEDYNANWNRAGAFALVEYLEELEADNGESIEFDCVAIRCEYSQHESLQKWAHDYFGTTLAGEVFLIGGDTDTDELDEKIREYIQEHGQLIEFEGGIVVSAF